MIVHWKLTPAYGVPHKMTVHHVDKAEALPHGRWARLGIPRLHSCPIPPRLASTIAGTAAHRSHLASQQLLLRRAAWSASVDFLRGGTRGKAGRTAGCSVHTSAQGPRGGSRRIGCAGSGCSGPRNKFHGK